MLNFVLVGVTIKKGAGHAEAIAQSFPVIQQDYSLLKQCAGVLAHWFMEH